MKELGDWKLTTGQTKESKLYSASDREHLIRFNKQDLAEVEYSGSDIVIKTRETKITIKPNEKSIHIIQN